MKAIVVREFGNPETMKIEDIAVPEPSAGEILIKVEAIGVNPVDTYIRNGIYPLLPQLPYTPGMDSSGTVEKVGEGVTDFKPGDRVYTAHSISGTYAEFATCRIGQLFRLPDNVDFKKGASVGVPAAAAWRALFLRGQARPGQSLLVHGASGSVGLAAIQLASAAGLQVFGTAGTEFGRSLALDMGASAVFDHGDIEYMSDLLKSVGTGGFDLILEMLANANLEKDLQMLSPRGRIVVIGNRGRIEIDPRMTMGKETDIRGMSLFNATEEELFEMHAALHGSLKSGVLDPVVSQELPLEKAPESHHKVLESGNCGKIVLIP